MRIDDVSITAPPPTITGAATATAFTTTYGTASAAQSFSVSGSSLTANLVATAQTGFEVATTQNGTYGSSVTFTQSSGSASGTVWVRLASNAAVSGSYNGVTAVALTSTGATQANITTAASGNSVTAKGLTITGLSAANKNWDGNTTVSVTGTPAYSGLVNSETFSVTGTVTWAFPDANVGTSKTLTRTGSYSAPSSNYTVTQPTLTANIVAVAPGAPAITGITAGNTQLSVAFTAPSSNGGASITNYEYSTNGGTNWTTPSPAVTSSPLLITGLTNGTTYDVQIRAVNSAGSGTATATTQATPVAPSSPTITAAPSTLGGALSTTYGTASSAQSFTVSGSTLSGDLTVTAPAGLEVSLSSGSGYSDSLNLTATSGAVSSTTVYVRLKANAAAGSYNSQNIGVSGGGATPQNVATASGGNTVGQKAINVTGLTFQNKVYDRTTSASATGTAALSGVETADAANVSLSGTPTYSFASSGVGTAIAISTTGYSISGSASDNYSLTQPSGSADITGAPLTVTGATATSRAYNATTTVAITGGTLSGVISGDTVTLGGSPTGTVATAGAGTGKDVTVTGFSISGTHAANYLLSQPTGLIVDITQATQTITFSALSYRLSNSVPFNLSATASSGLPVTYVSSNPGVATISGNTVTIVGTGTTTITASQAGDSNYSAASNVTQTLTVYLPALLAWEVNGLSGYGSSPFNATTVNSDVTAGGLTRGSGVTTSGTAGANAWGGTGFDTASLSAAVTAGDFVTFTVSAKANKAISLSTILPYNIRRNNSPGPTTGQWQYSLNGTTFTDIGSSITWGSNTSAPGNDQAAIDLSGIAALQNVGSGTTITFRVVNWSGVSAGSWYFNNTSTDDLALAGTVISVPQAPAISSITPGNGQLSVAFTPPSDNGGAAISNYEFSTNGGTSFTAVSPAAITSPIVITGLSNGTAYNVQIRAVNVAGKGVATASTSATPYTTPSAPTLGAITPGNGQLSVAFTAGVTGGSAITDYQWSLDGTNFTSSAGTSSPIVISDLTNGTAYTVRLRAVNAAGNGVVATAGSTATPRTTPDVPTISGITAGNGQLSVAFSAPGSNGGATITNYEYSLNGGTSWTARSPANTASPLIISGLVNGTTYDVQIRAVNSAGSGAASSTVQGAPVAPAVPTITLSKASLAAKTTTYGTPSSAETFTVSGVTLTGDNLTVTAPAGFEVSADGTSYSSSLNLTISSGAVAETTLYVRLAATAAVTGSYNSQNIIVSGGGADSPNVVTASTGNSVTAKTLTITGLNATSKTYDGTTSVSVTGTAAYSGLANGETFSVLDTVTWAFANASVGTGKTLVQTGTYTAPTTNYSVPTQPTLTADITQATAPTLVAAVGATVDNSFEVTFTETSSLWRSSITSITVGGTTLSASAYNTSVSGKITFNPANSALLQSAGSKAIVIVATGHGNGTVTQSIGAGAAVQLSVVTQPTAPASNGAALATQPVVRLLDLYNNVTTSTANVTAAATQGTWTLGGTTTVAAVNGTATFSGLTATSAAAVTGATITFSSSGLTGVPSFAFNISAPPAANDSTSTAIALTVDAAASSGSFAGSTPTFSPTSTLNDVWYKFVATSTSHTLTVIGGSAGMDPDIRVYEGGGGSFNTAPTGYTTPAPLVIGQLAGVTEETVIATNFVVGRTYFVMVQEDGTTAGGSFTIRVRTASASIATWNPTWSGTAASPLAATSKDTNLDSGALARVGLAGQTSSNRYNSSGWNSSANYLTVTLSAATGYRLDLNDQIIYGNWGISGPTGPGWFEVRSSVDNYASIIGYFDVSTSSHALGAIKLPSSGYSGLSSVTFRIISSSTQFSGTGAVASGATGGPSALRVTGTLVQIPSVTAATVAGTVGTAVNYNIVASGSPTSYAISSGTLPSGLSLNTTTGAITGTPTAAATGTVVSVTASNSAGTSTAANLTFNIAKGTPTITAAPTASAITYGQTLADSVLSGGTASVAGGFAFTSSSTAPNAGTASQGVTFTPTDTTNYNTATTTVSVTVNPASLAITAVAKSKVYGAADPALTYTSSGLVGSDSISGGLARAAGENAGIYAINQGTLSAGPNYSISYTGANLTITAAALPAVTWSNGVISGSGGVGSFSYVYSGRSSNGISTSYSNSVAPAAAGYYTAVATSTDGNYTGSTTNSYFITGPVAGNDSATKPANNAQIKIPTVTLLANDSRIHTDGTILTDNLSITAVANGTGAASISGAFVLFTPSASASDSFSYTVTDAITGKTATGTVTVTTEAAPPSFDLQIVGQGTASYNGTQTSITMDFIGVPNQTYTVEYKGELADAAWTSAGAQPTGSTGSFSVTFTKAGNHTADWNGSMFFRASVGP